MQHLAVFIIQTHLFWENPTKNRAHLEKEFANILEPVDLIVLPEMFTTGFTMNAAEMAETPNGITTKWLQKWAKKKNTAIVGSIICKEENSNKKIEYYNRLLFVYPSGRIVFYNKRHLFTLAREHTIFTAGTEKIIISYKGWKICPLICYDLRFPVWSRNTENYDVLLYVASWPTSRINAWNVLLKARAIENMSYVIGVNRIGVDKNDITYTGNSAVIDYLGNIMKKCVAGKNDTIKVILDKFDLEKTRKKLNFLKDKDPFKIV